MGLNGPMNRGEIEIRHTEPHERLAATIAKGVALLAHPMSQAVFDENADSWDDCASISAWDGDRCVGHAGAYAFDVTIPGGRRVPLAGVTRVGVLPTHTRRGLLRQMMEQLLREAHAGGQMLAALHASETAIYRQFGFGLATESADVVVDTRAALPRHGAGTGTGGAMTVLQPEEVGKTVPDVYERAARDRVGTVDRAPWMWRRILKGFDQPSTEGFGAPARFVALHTTAGEPDGYVRYTVQWDEDIGDNPTGVGDLHELWGADPAVEGALWDFLLRLDLVTRWRARARPAHEPIVRILGDRRAYRTVGVFDEQWVRLLDVDAAFRTRSYGPAESAVVVEIDDPLFPDNRGRWRIDPHGAERTDARPHIALGIESISALYYGAQSWRELATTGELSVIGGDDRVLARADALFDTRPTPFCGTGY